MPLIENKNLILIEECPDTIFKNCSLIITVPFESGKERRDSFTGDFIDITERVHQSVVFYFPRMRKIFDYLRIEKKLLKLHRACEINKNNCSQFIFNNFPFNEFKDVYDVWTLPNVNEEMWDNYKIFKLKNLPEQKLLNKGAEILNRRLKELNCNLKTFHEKAKKPKSKMTS